MPPPPARSAVVRLRPAPAYDPPYDDEQHPGFWADALSGTIPRPPAPTPRPTGRAAATGGPAPGARPPASPAGRSGASPPARLAAARFVNSCLEIFNGLRPLSHARQLAHPLHAQQVLTAFTYATRRLRHAARHLEGRAALVKVRRLRVCEPRPGTVEIAAAIGFTEPPTPTARVPPSVARRRPQQRTWAAAFRLERRHDRWQCTAAGLL